MGNAIQNSIMSGIPLEKDVKILNSGIFQITAAGELSFALNGTNLFHFLSGLYLADITKVLQLTE